jgi:tol-pal system protein YbgF
MRTLPLLGTVAALTAALLAGCATGPTRTQIAVQNLQTRVSRLDHFVTNGSLVHLAQQQSELRAEVRDLRGKIDQLEQENRRLTRQQHDLYASLDKRLQALARSRAASAPPPEGSAALPGVSAAEEKLYGLAFNALKAGHYTHAAKDFQQFVTKYPNSPLEPDAQYWLGEAQFVNDNYSAAEQAFRSVLKNSPHSLKAPEAMFDLGNTLIAQGKTAEGRRTLAQVIKRYPDSNAARRAASALAKPASD